MAGLGWTTLWPAADPVRHADEETLVSRNRVGPWVRESLDGAAEHGSCHRPVRCRSGRGVDQAVSQDRTYSDRKYECWPVRTEAQRRARGANDGSGPA
jgi:hypothetical protein